MIIKEQLWITFWKKKKKKADRANDKAVRYCECLNLLFHPAAGKKSLNSHIVLSLLSAHARISFHAAASTLMLAVEVYHCIIDTFSSLASVFKCMERYFSFCMFLLFLPLLLCCSLTLGERTGTRVSETRQACEWCPSYSTGVWSGSACHSS